MHFRRIVTRTPVEGGASAPPPRIRRFISQVSKCGCEFLHIFFCSTSVRHGNKVSHTSSHRCAPHGGKLSTGCRSSPAQCACATIFRSSSDRRRVADWPAISDGGWSSSRATTRSRPRPHSLVLMIGPVHAARAPVCDASRQSAR